MNSIHNDNEDAATPISSNSFWCIKVFPRKPVTINLTNYPFHCLRLTQATLGSLRPNKKDIDTSRSLLSIKYGGNRPVIICSLRPKLLEMTTLCINLQATDDIVFTVVGPRTIDLIGFFYNYLSPINLPLTIGGDENQGGKGGRVDDNGFVNLSSLRPKFLEMSSLCTDQGTVPSTIDFFGHNFNHQSPTNLHLTIGDDKQGVDGNTQRGGRRICSNNEDILSRNDRIRKILEQSIPYWIPFAEEFHAFWENSPHMPLEKAFYEFQISLLRRHLNENVPAITEDQVFIHEDYKVVEQEYDHVKNEVNQVVIQQDIQVSFIPEIQIVAKDDVQTLEQEEINLGEKDKKRKRDDMHPTNADVADNDKGSANRDSPQNLVPDSEEAKKTKKRRQRRKLKNEHKKQQKLAVKDEDDHGRCVAKHPVPDSEEAKENKKKQRGKRNVAQKPGETGC